MRNLTVWAAFVALFACLYFVGCAARADDFSDNLAALKRLNAQDKHSVSPVDPFAPKNAGKLCYCSDPSQCTCDPARCQCGVCAAAKTVESDQVGNPWRWDAATQTWWRWHLGDTAGPWGGVGSTSATSALGFTALPAAGGCSSWGTSRGVGRRR